MSKKLKPTNPKENITKGTEIFEDPAGGFYRVDQVKTKRKITRHPRIDLYLGMSGGYTYNVAFMAMLAKYSQAEMEEVLDGTRLLNEQATKDFIASVQENDIIGIKNSTYKVMGTDGENIFVDDKSKTKEGFHLPVLTMQEIDFARELGFAEILKRGESLYGVPEEEDIIVSYPVPCTKNGADKRPKKLPVQPASKTTKKAKV